MARKKHRIPVPLIGDFVPSDYEVDNEPQRKRYRYAYEPTEAEMFGGISAGTGAFLAVGGVIAALAVYAYFSKKQSDEYIQRMMYGK